MRSLRTVLGGALLIAGYLAAVMVLYAALPGETHWLRKLECLQSLHILCAVGAILLILLLSAFIYVDLREVRNDKFLTYESEGGAVSISLRAVTEFIAKLAGEYAAVLHLKPSVRIVDEALDVTLDVKVRADARIPELSQALQDRVRETVGEHLGFAEVRTVTVNIREIVADGLDDSAA